jgi:hypothetical protein
LDIHWEEIKRLYKVTDELEMDLLSVSKLLLDEVPLGRNKGKVQRLRRGLINLFGYGLKYLFGTADARDVRRSNEVCDRLQSFQTKVVHATEQQMTYLHTLDNAITANARATLGCRQSIKRFDL